MKSIQAYEHLFSEDYLKTKKERLYLESVAKAQLRALKRLERKLFKEEALTYMYKRFEERLGLYKALYVDDDEIDLGGS